MNKLNNLLGTYKLIITPLGEEDGPGYIARYEELGLSVRGIGATQIEALQELESMALEGFDDVPLKDLPIASSQVPWAEYSGRVTLRLPKVLHAKIHRHADEQGVSLNQWMCQILESGTTALASGYEFGAVVKRKPAAVEKVAALRVAANR